MNADVIKAFNSACGKAQIFVDATMPIGVFHDFLMEIKGLMVDRMIKAHQDQLEQAKAAMGNDDQPCEENNGHS